LMINRMARARIGLIPDWALGPCHEAPQQRIYASCGFKPLIIEIWSLIVIVIG